MLDSNICIYVIEGIGDALRWRIEACEDGELVVSSISYAEVMRGIEPGDAAKFGRAEALFGICPVQDFGRAAALRYGELPFKRGTFDRLIAAHALATDLTLVTNNISDFADVPGLRVENWTV